MAKKKVNCRWQGCKRMMLPETAAAGGGFCQDHAGRARELADNYDRSNASSMAIGAVPSILHPELLEKALPELLYVPDSSPSGVRARRRLRSFASTELGSESLGTPAARVILNSVTRWESGFDHGIPAVARKRLVHGPEEMYQLVCQDENLGRSDIAAVYLTRFSGMELRARPEPTERTKHLFQVQEIDREHRAVVVRVDRQSGRGFFVIDPLISALAPVGTDERIAQKPVSSHSALRNTPFVNPPWVTTQQDYRSLDSNGVIGWKHVNIEQQFEKDGGQR